MDLVITIKCMFIFCYRIYKMPPTIAIIVIILLLFVYFYYNQPLQATALSTSQATSVLPQTTCPPCVSVAPKKVLIPMLKMLMDIRDIDVSVDFFMYDDSMTAYVPESVKTYKSGTDQILFASMIAGAKLLQINLYDETGKLGGRVFASIAGVMVDRMKPSIAADGLLLMDARMKISRDVPFISAYIPKEWDDAGNIKSYTLGISSGATAFNGKVYSSNSRERTLAFPYPGADHLIFTKEPVVTDPVTQTDVLKSSMPKVVVAPRTSGTVSTIAVKPTIAKPIATTVAKVAEYMQGYGVGLIEYAANAC
jgi:hypothetical protein